MATKTSVKRKFMARELPVSDEDLRRQALRRWKYADREVTFDGGTLDKLWVSRAAVIGEIKALSKKKAHVAKAKRLVAWAWERLHKLEARIEGLKAVYERAGAKKAKGIMREIEKLCLGLLPERRLAVWALCRKTKNLRAYVHPAAEVSALWDEFWSLGGKSVQQEHASIGEDEKTALFCDDEGVRDADRDADDGKPCECGESDCWECSD